MCKFKICTIVASIGGCYWTKHVTVDLVYVNPPGGAIVQYGKSQMC